MTDMVKIKRTAKQFYAALIADKDYTRARDIVRRMTKKELVYTIVEEPLACILDEDPRIQQVYFNGAVGAEVQRFIWLTLDGTFDLYQRWEGNDRLRQDWAQRLEEEVDKGAGVEVSK